MKVAVGSDHAGFGLKTAVIAQLTELGHEAIDFGTHSAESVDYPDFIKPAAEAAAKGEADRAIVIGGSGNGEAIVANKVSGIRCSLCHDVTTARLAREHNDANALSLGARIIGSEVARDVVTVWLATPFSGDERHARRIRKISEIDTSR